MMHPFFSSLRNSSSEQDYLYFDGKSWKQSESGKTIPVYSPVNGSVLGQVQAITAQEADEVIAQLSEKQKSWRLTPMYERIRILKKASLLLREYENDFVEMLVMEIGKSKEESRNEVTRTADLIDYSASEAQSLRGQYIHSDTFQGVARGRHAFVQYVPHGVVLAIGPFNYPINLTASKIAPALLMGNTVVFKPPTQGSIVGLMLTHIFTQAGVPEGCISCLTGKGKEIGDFLVSHKRVNMIAFTGSTDVGKKIAAKAGMTPLLFECGGNNGVIVLDDAEIDFTAKEIIKGAFAYAGQRCTGIKYILATEQTFSLLIPKLEAYLSELVKMGDPREDGTKLVGPLISEQAAIDTESAVNDAMSHGAAIVTGGKRNGWYMEPTILDRVTTDMLCVKTEIFGPILSCIRISHKEEAVEILNQSDFGLQASIFTADEGTGLVLSEQINVGTVQINGSPQRGPDHFPFLGIKDSGVGVQGIRYSLEAMSRIHSIVMNNPS